MRKTTLKQLSIYSLVFIILLSAVKLTGAAEVFLGKYSNADDNRLLYMYSNGYRENEPNTAILIKSYPELMSYYTTYKDKYNFDIDRQYAKGYNIKNFRDIVLNGYDENWFKKYDLVLIVSNESSGSYYYRLKSLDFFMTTAKIVLYRDAPSKNISSDMVGWHTFVEIEKKSYILSAEVSIVNKET